MTDPLISPVPKNSKLVTAAVVVAFVIVAVDLVIALFHPFAGLLATIVPLIAAIGILRKRIWAAYGYALLQLAQGALAIALVVRDNNISVLSAGLFSFVSAALFFFAGRQLAGSGGKPGLAVPWIALACVLAVPFVFARAFSIPTGAMEDTLLIGDRILVRVFPQVTPGRGDLVAFRYPMDRKETFIKRVIGMPGDRVRIASKAVYVNGQMLKEPYAVHKISEADEFRDNLPHDLPAWSDTLGPGVGAAGREMMRNHVVNGEVVVPAGKYFVLGDNRDNSLDSRYWGFVDKGDLVGKPVLIYASEEAVADAPKIGWPKVRWGRVLRVL